MRTRAHPPTHPPLPQTHLPARAITTCKHAYIHNHIHAHIYDIMLKIRQLPFCLHDPPSSISRHQPSPIPQRSRGWVPGFAISSIDFATCFFFICRLDHLICIRFFKATVFKFNFIPFSTEIHRRLYSVAIWLRDPIYS